MPIKPDLIDAFGREIKPRLEDGFDNYDSGNEINFLNDFLSELDNIVVGAAGQHLHTKVKKIHGYPQADFNTNVRSHPHVDDDIINQIEDKTPEIADLLVILNVYENSSVKYRRAFFSQTKCVDKVKTGYQYWKVDATQYYFLRAKPSFELDYDDSGESFDLSGIRSSALNYSFVGNIHRPFFYRPENMPKYFRSMSNYQKFVYGTNSVMGFRLPISVLKTLLYGRFGEEFGDNSELYKLISEIYQHATLSDSDSTQVLTDGGNTTLMGSRMGIVEINVDTDGSFGSELPPPSDNDLRVENISQE